MSLLLLLPGDDDGGGVVASAGVVQVLIGGVDVTALIDFRSLRWEDQLNGRGTLSCTLVDDVGGFVPEDGQEILVLEDSVRRFGGMLLEPEEAATPANDLIVFGLQATEFSSICDRHLVARAYTNQTLKAIVLDIVAQDMPEDMVDTDGVEDGPTIKKAVFNWITVTDAFNQLAELAGMAWRIDENRVLQFRERASISAPATLTNSNVWNGTLRIRPDRQQYRNRQVLRAGAGLTDARTETFVGDGTRRTFNTAFKVGAAPTVTVNGVAKTVGIRQVETGKDWYWNKGVTELSQDSGGAVLADTDVLSVSYQGLFPIIIAASRGAEISARKAVEGGSGRYSRVEERSNIETIDAAIAATQAMLDRYGTISRIISCDTNQPGYAPGQLVPCAFSAHGIADDYLIDAVSVQWIPGEGFRYSLRAISGDPYGGWQEYFRRLLKIGRQFVINENEVVVGLQELSDSATASDSVTHTAAAPAKTVGVARVDFSAVRAA